MKNLFIITILIVSANIVNAQECDKYLSKFPISESSLLPRTSKTFNLSKNEIAIIEDTKQEIILLNAYQYNRLPVGTALYDTSGNIVIKNSIEKIEHEGFLDIGFDKKKYTEHLEIREERHFADKRVLASWTGVDISISETPEGRKQIVKYLESLEDITWVWFDTETTGLSALSSQLTEIYAGAGRMKFDRTHSKVIYEQTSDSHLKIKLNNQSIQKIIRDIKNPKEGSSRATLRELLVMQNYPFVAQNKVLSKPMVTLAELDLEWSKLLESQDSLINENEAITELFNLFKEHDKTVQVAHNLPFDMNMVNGRALSSNNTYYLGSKNHSLLDTEILVKKYWIPLHEQRAEAGDKISIQIIKDLTKEGKRGPYVSASMGMVTKAMGITNDGWHQADADVRMMIKLFIRLYSDLAKSII